MPVLRNTLYVPTIEHNLLPPFILREARIKCNYITNIYVKYPDVDDHALSFAVINIRIPLQLWGVFSYFHTRVPTSDNIIQCDQVLLPPGSTKWDPY